MTTIQSEQIIRDILSNLEMTFRANDNEIRKKAEIKLKESESFLLSNLSVFFTLIKQNSISKEITNALVIYIKNVLINQKKNKMLSKEFLLSLIQSLILCLLDSEFPSKYQKEMNKAFEEIINCKILEEDESIIESLVTLFQTKIISGDINVNSYKGTSYILENILCVSCVNCKNANKIIIIELNCCEIMLTNIITKLEEINVDNSTVILNYIDTIKVIYDLLLNISVHCQQTYFNIEHFSYILQSTFQKIGIKMLNFIYEEENEIVLKMKTKIFKFFISLIGQIKTYSDMKEIIHLHRQLISFCINFFSKLSLLKKLIENKIFENYINQMIIYLSKICFKSSFEDDLKRFLFSFTKNIIFPLLISRKSEIESLKEDEDGTNYSVYIYDMITTRKAQNIKVTISKFISTAIKKDEQFINFLLEYSILLIEYSLKLKQNDINCSDIMLSNQIDDISRIETSFLVMCMVSTNVNTTHIETLLHFIQRVYPLMIKESHVNILKQRFCFFISIYIERFLSLSSIENEFFIKISEFLFYNIFMNKTTKIAQYESFESLKVILASNLKFKENFVVVSQKYMSEFIEYSRNSNNVLFFDILSEIINSINNDEILFELIKNLFRRIFTEISPRRLSHSMRSEMQIEQNLNSNYKIIIAKCFCIIKLIFTNQNFITNHFSDIDEMITPLLVYMKHPNKIDFDEDFIQIMIALIQTLKSIPPCAIKLFPDLCQYLRKKKGLTVDLFQLLNLYIIYSNDAIENYDDFCKSIFKNFKRSFAKESNNIVYSSYLGTCLMQILILNSKKIPEQIIIDMIAFLTERINTLLFGEKSNHSDLVISDQLQILSLAMITLLTDTYVNYCRIASTHLQIENIIKFLEFQVAFSNISCYQINMLVYGISSFMIEENMPRFFDSKIGYLITLESKFLLKYQSKNEKNKKTQQSQINSITNEEEIEIELDEHKSFDKIQKESFDITNNDYNEIDNIIVNPIKNINLYLIYKDTIELINKKYPNEYVNMISSYQTNQQNLFMFISSITSCQCPISQ